MSLPRKASTHLLCCWTTIRRIGPTRSISLSTIQRGKYWDRVGDYVRHTFGLPQDQAFTKETINRMHKKDRISQDHWVLIHNDLMHVRYRSIIVIFVPFLITTLSFTIYDYRKTNGKFSNPQLDRLRNDAYQLGFLFYIIVVLMAMSLTCQLRNIQMRVFRVYQSVLDPTKYKIFRAKNLMFSEWVEASRANIKPIDTFYAEQNIEHANVRERLTVIFSRYIFGQVKINGDRVLIDQLFFKGNSFRSYMMHETKDPPRLVIEMRKKLLAANASKT